MAGYFATIVLIVTTAIYYLHYKKCNTLFIYNILWGTLFFFTAASLYGMAEIKNESYIILLMGSIFFAIGDLTGEKPIKFKRSYNRKKLFIRLICIKERVLIFLLVALFIFYFINSIHTFSLLMQGKSYVYIRNLHQGYVEDKMFANRITMLIHTIIGTPAIKASVILNISMLILDFKKNKTIIILTILDTVLYCFSTAGRFMIFYAVALVGINIIRFRRFLPRIKINKIVSVAIIGILFMVIVTQARGMGDKETGNKIFKTVYMYFASPIGLFDYWKNYMDDAHIRMYGKMFFYGIVDILDSIIKYLFQIKWDVLKDASTILNNTERFIKLYRSNTINAFVTSSYYYYADFGILGVMIGNSVHGFLVGLAEKKFSNNINLWNICLLNFFATSVIETFIRWTFVSLSNVMTIIIIFFLTNKIKPMYNYCAVFKKRTG